MGKEISQNELKQSALEILIDFDNACREHNLRYSIAYGTMIGAIRHQGFIPWDDDIDVIMPREDYNIFCSISSSCLKSNHKLLSVNIDSRFGAPLPKIVDTNTSLVQIGHVSEKIELGVYIDIFIMDKIPEDIKQRDALFKKCYYLQKAWRFCGNAPSNGHFSIINFIRSISNRTPLGLFFAKKLMNIGNTQYEGSKYSVLIFTVYGYEKDIRDISDLDDCIDLYFEGNKVKGLRNYDDYLHRLYGDYMKLPPLEKRITHHDFVAYKK